MGTTNLVIVEGPEIDELLTAFRNACCKEDNAHIVLKTLCSKTTDAEIGKYRIISLTHEDGSGLGFKFLGFHALTNVKVRGYYNCRNKHGYMLVGDEVKE